MNEPEAVSAGESHEKAAFLTGYRALLERVRERYDDPASHLELARFLIQHDRLAKAYSSLRVARALQPARVETHYLIGWVHQKEGNLRDAMMAYRRILRVDPREAQAHFHMGCLLETQGDDRQAVEAFTRVVDLDATFADAYVRLGHLARKSGDLPRALQWFQTLRERQPRDPQVLHELARCYEALGVKDRAVLALEAALQLAPDHLPSRLCLAGLYLQSGSLPQAERSLRAILERWPRSPEGYLLLARLHEQAGRKPQSLAALLQFQKLFPLDHRGPYEMGRAYLRSDENDLALRELARAQELAPGDLEVAMALGEAYERAGDRDNAVKQALLLCEKRPRDSNSYERLAAVHRRFGRLQEALEAMDRAIGLAPDDDRLHCERARIHVESGDYDSAVQAFQRAREINPGSQEARLDSELIRSHKSGRKARDLHEKALAATERGDFSQALACHRQAIELVPDQPEWLRSAFEVLLQLGQFQEAGAALEKLLALSPLDAGLLRRAAQIRYHLGDYENAFRLYERAVSLDAADVASRVGVLRSMGHRFLDRTVPRDRYPALLTAYRENLGTSGGSPLARLELGYLYLTLGRIAAEGNDWRERARECLGAVGDSAERDELIWRLRGLHELALLEGDEAGQAAAARRIAELEPSQPLHVLAYLEALLHGATPGREELAHASRMLESHAQHGYLRSFRARLFRKHVSGRSDEAHLLRSETRRYQQAISEEPRGIWALFDLGVALRYLAPAEHWTEHARRGDIAFGKAAGLDERNVWPIWGMVRNAAGSPDGEHRAPRSRFGAVVFKALRRFPGEPVLHYYAGSAMIGSADVSERESGLRELNCAVVTSPEMGPAHLELARHYRSHRETLAAHHHFLHVLETLPGARHASEVRMELSRLL